MSKTSESYAQEIDEICPGDSITVNFPEGFTLQYYKYENGEMKLKEFTCVKLNVYHWDDDDHWCVDYYYYEPKETYNGVLYNWTCKDRHLTPESRLKVSEYLCNNKRNK